MAGEHDLVVDDQGAISRRSLHIIIMADTSSSMDYNAKIQSLNEAGRNVLIELKDIAGTHTEADLMLRVMSFSSAAQWQTPEAQRVTEYEWSDLSASGSTSLGEAIDLLNDALDDLPPYQYPPVIALVSDGGPTDDWESALQRFNESKYGKSSSRTVRTAIAIGDDADTAVLTRFTGNSETVLTARTTQQLVAFLRWATVQMSSQVSGSRDYGAGDGDEDELGSKSAQPRNLPIKPIVEENENDDLF